MSIFAQGLLYGWKKNLEYGPKLVNDLSDEQMTLQPAPEGSAPSNHPAWVLSHLNVYIPLIESLIRGEQFDDPKTHRFGMMSKPEADRSIYQTKDKLVSDFVAGHERVIDLLSSADNSVFERDTPLERWAAIMPKVGIVLPYLMLVHENLHFGQLSAWRRIQGMPSV
jgi:hypothetical protein